MRHSNRQNRHQTKRKAARRGAAQFNARRTQRGDVECAGGSDVDDFDAVFTNEAAIVVTLSAAGELLFRATSPRSPTSAGALDVQQTAETDVVFSQKFFFAEQENAIVDFHIRAVIVKHRGHILGRKLAACVHNGGARFACCVAKATARVSREQQTRRTRRSPVPGSPIMFNLTHCMANVRKSDLVFVVGIEMSIERC